MDHNANALTDQPGFHPGFLVIHGNRAEDLRDLVVRWMQRYPPPPLGRDTVITQSNGMAQWLTFSLAGQPASADAPGALFGGGLGICAGLDTVLPARFTWWAYRAVLGADVVPEASPVDKPRLVWRLMRVLPQTLDDPAFAPLARFLRADEGMRRRLQLCQRLADLYDQYQVYRADWLAAWAAGEDVWMDALGEPKPLGADRWQAALWRAVLEDLQQDADWAHAPVGHGRAAAHAAFLQAVRDWPDGSRPAGLPARVFVFGLSSLPRQALEVLGAIARWTQVLLCVHNPCQYYWADIIEDRALIPGAAGRHPRRPEASRPADPADLHPHGHPLLAAWGRQGRDFIGLLTDQDRIRSRDADTAVLEAMGEPADIFRAPGGETLLAQLQDDILSLRTLPETRAQWPGVDPARDPSIRFHSSHSPQREVEVLHDRLLALMESDDDLHPGNCLVMVPDIEAYAPHIQAVFGRYGRDDPRHIPFDIADQGPRQTDPIVQAVELLLRLSESRLGVSQVLDLLEVPALRRRFGIDAADLPRLHRWLEAVNVRWGLDSDHRQALGLPAGDHPRHTWAHGLERMLLGYATGETRAPWQDIAPFAETGGLEAALVGQLEGLIRWLGEIWRQQQSPRDADAWVACWQDWLAALFEPGDSDEQAALLDLESALLAWRDEIAAAGFDEPLPANVVADCWTGQLEQGGVSQRFLAGSVAFATLMPMRAVPFRFVALLGMNDGDYPRARPAADFDLMAADYRPGDRSRREDDRYLFLEALLSARRYFYCSWVGRSVNDNTPRPASVLVGQLRDHLEAGWRLAEDAGLPGQSLLDALTQTHPLQPFSRQYFEPGTATSGVDGLYTFAGEWRDPAQAGGAGADSAFAPQPLPEPAPVDGLETVVDLAMLQTFLRDPTRDFFRDRLGVSFSQRLDAAEDEEALALDGLMRWRVGRQLIEALTATPDPATQAVDLQPALEEMVRAGDIPGEGPGAWQAQALAGDVAAMAERYSAVCRRWPRASAPGRVELDVGLRLMDTLPGLRHPSDDDHAALIIGFEPSEMKKNGLRYDRLVAPWLEHLLANAVVGEVTTRVIGRDRDAVIDPVAGDTARRLLAGVVALWQEGRCRPVALPPRTALAHAKSPNTAAAQTTYEGTRQIHGEVEKSPYVARLYPDYAALLADSDFAALAEAIYRPLLDAARVADEASP